MRVRPVRTAILSALASAFLLSSAGPAAAHFDRFGYTLTPEITPSGARATFFIDCTAGETYRIQVKISQGQTSTSSVGEATGNCTGKLQTVRVFTTYVGGADNEFRPGEGTMGFRAWTFSGGTPDSATGTITNPVTLRDNE